MVVRRLTFLLLTGVLSALFAVPALAQTSGGLKGTVLDKDGQPLPTARVTITNASLGISQAAVTDAKGEFRVVPLPPGKGYSLRVDFPEMSTVNLSDIEVLVNKVLSVPITMRPSSENTVKVRVTATSDVVNQESTTTQTNISSEFIDALPILGRNYQDVLTLAPGVTDVDGDGNPNIHGARDTDVNTLVDGVSTVDPVTGQVGQQLNLESIEEIEVKTSGAPAEFGRAQGGFVAITTKSGGNDFEGSFRFDWRGNTLDGDGAGIDNAKLHGGLTEVGLRDLTFNDLYPLLTVSGPIKRDKAWYFVTAEYRQEETPVNALTQAFVRGLKEKRIFGKFSWDISTNHKLVFNVTTDPQEFTNLGLDSFTAVESGYTNQLGGPSLVLRETAVFSPNVFLDSTLQDFKSGVNLVPTLDADTNGNGVLFIDRNHNGFIDASERDPGEDFDRDGKFDVFEDKNHNGTKDDGEDRDMDTRLTTSSVKGIGGGCEGVTREDIDCDGHLDFLTEDNNGDGILEPGEDRDMDGHLDLGIEDRNKDFVLNDRPFVSVTDADTDPNGVRGNFYPYYESAPISRDRDYEQDQRTLRRTGPYNRDFNGDRGRQTLREDLTIFVPDWHGQHELKTGINLEREHYTQTTNLRPDVLPNLNPPTGAQFVPTVGVVLPAENQVSNSASSLTGAIYVQDTYKPLPNLTFNVGLRFEREATDSFGYTQFDPAGERTLYDRLDQLNGGEFIRGTDLQNGNADGILSQGYRFDPFFAVKESLPSYPVYQDLSKLSKIALSRLTQHHTSTDLVAQGLSGLFPDLEDPSCKGQPGCPLIQNRELLRSLGATFQEEEPFRLTNNNLAPRLAVSWDPWADSKTKVFATWSRFYDKLFLNTVIPEEGPDQISRYYHKDSDGITGTGIPNNGFGDAITKAPPSASQVDRGLQTPFTDEFSIGFERELAPEVSLRLSYLSRNARLGLQDRDINHATRTNPTTGEFLDQYGRLATGAGSSGGGTPVGDNIPDLFIYNYFFNQIFRLGNFNTSTYKGIELQITKRLSRKWQMDTSYTYSRTQGDAEDFQSALGDDPASLPYEYGYLNFDQRHVVRFNGTTFLPGDWTFGGVLSWASGLPYSAIATTFDLDNFSYGQNRTLFGRITPTTSGPVFTGEQRNSRRNPSVLQIDLQATKAFVIGRFNSKLFLAVQNLLNTDDITVASYQPDNSNRGGALQLDAERKFGRRYQIGFQFEF
jgi:outer membrane receptor protein involved in Fe transport